MVVNKEGHCDGGQLHSFIYLMGKNFIIWDGNNNLLLREQIIITMDIFNI